MDICVIPITSVEDMDGKGYVHWSLGMKPIQVLLTLPIWKS